MSDNPTATAAPQERLRAIVTETEGLLKKGVRSADETKRLEELLTEGHTLQEQIAQNERASGLLDFARSSAGMVALTPAGESQVVTNRETGEVRIAEEYGEGLYDPKVRKVIEDAKYKKAFRSYLRTPAGQQTDHVAIRTLQEGADSSGGFLVPNDLLDRIVSREPTPTRVASRVTQLQTGRDNLVIPKVNYSADDLYTTGMRVTWTGEVPASSTAMRVTDPVFGQSNVPVYTAMMSIPVTNDQIEDAAFPLMSFLTDKFAETVELLRDNMILNGSGQGQPSGILLNPGADATQPAVINSGQAATIGTDGKFLVNLAFALPEQYDMNAAWVFNKTSTGNAIANLVDGNGRFLWGAGLQDSGLDVDIHNRRLLGYPVVFSGFAPSIAANAYPIIFGDLKGYYLVNRIGFSVQVLRELYAETNQVLVLGRLRLGGQVVEPWKLKVGRCHS